MQFAVKYHPRASNNREDWKQLRSRFLAWQPPEGVEIEHHYHFLSNDGVVIVNSPSPEHLLKALLPFEPMVEFQIEVIVNVYGAMADALDTEEAGDMSAPRATQH